MGFNVTDVQPTPNPNAAKFMLDREITNRPVSFLNPEEGRGDALASQLFGIEGVTSILMLGDFVTVNKVATVRWEQITDRVKEILQKAP